MPDKNMTTKQFKCVALQETNIDRNQPLEKVRMKKLQVQITCLPNPHSNVYVLFQTKLSNKTLFKVTVHYSEKLKGAYCLDDHWF